LRPHVPARDREPRPAARAPAAADGADAVAAALNVARGARGADADDGRAPPGRLAAARARQAGRDDGGADAALGPLRTVSVLRQGADEPPAGDGIDGPPAGHRPAGVA